MDHWVSHKDTRVACSSHNEHLEFVTEQRERLCLNSQELLLVRPVHFYIDGMKERAPLFIPPTLKNQRPRGVRCTVFVVGFYSRRDRMTGTGLMPAAYHGLTASPTSSRHIGI